MSACFAISGTFAAIFSFEASKKWIIREGLNGTSASGSGAPIASGLRKSRGFLTPASVAVLARPPARTEQPRAPSLGLP